eukprot:1038797-Prymnesium_polylepis.1
MARVDRAHAVGGGERVGELPYLPRSWGRGVSHAPIRGGRSTRNMGNRGNTGNTACSRVGAGYMTRRYAPGTRPPVEFLE